MRGYQLAMSLRTAILPLVLLLSAPVETFAKQWPCEDIAKFAGEIVELRIDGMSLTDSLQIVDKAVAEGSERNGADVNAISQAEELLREVVITAYELPAVSSIQMLPEGSQRRESMEMLVQRHSDKWHVRCLRGNSK